MSAKLTKPLPSRQAALEQKTLSISCIIPMHNEAEGIAGFAKQLSQTIAKLTDNFELIFVDDGSQDETTKVLEPLMEQDHSIKLLKLSRNFGKETALTAGLDHCKGEVTILIDGDAQHPLEVLPDFLNHWAYGYDMVYGLQNDRTHESTIKRYFTKSFYRSMQLITKINIVPNAGDFRLLDRRVVESLKQCHERSRFMKGLYAWVGYKSIGIPFTANPRQQGQSSWNFLSLLELAITGITSFSTVPLRVWGIIGLWISLCSFLYAVYVIAKTMIFGVDVPGYASIMVAIFFFGGIQLFSIGVLGEYIARIFNEVKQRPKYIVEKKIRL